MASWIFEDGYLRLKSIKWKPVPGKSLEIKGFEFCGDFIIKMGTITIKDSEYPKITAIDNVFIIRKYSISG